MNTIFEKLRQTGFLDQVSYYFDWLIDDNGHRFCSSENWSPIDTRNLTKELANYYMEKGITATPVSKNDALTRAAEIDGFKIICTPSDGIGSREVIAHMRNAIAHGNIKFEQVCGVDCIHMEDFENAYILIPLECFIGILAIADQKIREKQEAVNN